MPTPCAASPNETPAAGRGGRLGAGRSGTSRYGRSWTSSLMRWDSKPDNRIRRTSSHPAPTRFEELLANVSSWVAEGGEFGTTACRIPLVGIAATNEHDEQRIIMRRRNVPHFGMHERVLHHCLSVRISTGSAPPRGGNGSPWRR